MYTDTPNHTHPSAMKNINTPFLVGLDIIAVSLASSKGTNQRMLSQFIKPRTSILKMCINFHNGSNAGVLLYCN